MARYNGPVCRLCRRDGVKLFLKGTRCDSPKCAYERREAPPGMNQSRRAKLTDYGLHLREKQKLKHYYGVLERQFRKYYERAVRSKGNTGNTLVSLLERRLDNVISRLGFAQSRAQARQIIAHGHITVNGYRCDIPSYITRVGDVVRVKNRKASLELVAANLSDRRGDVPQFLTAVEEGLPEGHVVRLPEVDDFSFPVQTQLIIELCSR